MAWAYAGDDPGLRLFSAAFTGGAPMTFGTTPRWGCLEVGCCEADWLTLAGEAWPDCYFSGIDTRAPEQTEQRGKLIRSRANAMQEGNFPPETFAAVVMLSALEHIGLGHYGDPLDEDGDVKVLTNCWRWLKPGGWLYFDVPYSPVSYRVCGTEYRRYDDEALQERLWIRSLVEANARAKWAWTGYAKKDHTGALVEKPTEGDPERFSHYVALCWVKC